MLLSWQGDDLTSDDVAVDTDSELSDTPAQRRQTALELMNAGFFLDPDTHQMSRESRARLMEIFRMGSWENAVSLDEMHIARARREQAALIRGEIPKLTDYDDHRLHLTEHTRFMLGADYRRLQTERPALARAMAMHAEAPMRLAPASTRASASSRVWMPPAALTPQASPTVARMRRTSSTVAPPVEKPVLVFTNATPAATQSLQARTFSSSLRRQHSMIALTGLPWAASTTARTSRTT